MPGKGSQGLACNEGSHSPGSCHEHSARGKQPIAHQQSPFPARAVPQSAPRRRAKRSAKHGCADDYALDPVQAAAQHCHTHEQMDYTMGPVLPLRMMFVQDSRDHRQARVDSS